MADDLTVFQFDVDAEAVRTLLEAVPGISPDDLDELDVAEQADEQPEQRSGTTATPSTERTGPRVGETPPPGAGDAVESGDDETDSDEGRNTLLLAGIGATVLAAVAGVGLYVYRRRSSDGEALSVPAVDTDLDVIGDSEDGMDDDGSEDRTRSAVDAAPLVGMALLALGGAIVRHVQSSGDDAQSTR